MDKWKILLISWYCSKWSIIPTINYDHIKSTTCFSYYHGINYASVASLTKAPLKFDIGFRSIFYLLLRKMQISWASKCSRDYQYRVTFSVLLSLPFHPHTLLCLPFVYPRALIAHTSGNWLWTLIFSTTTLLPLYKKILFHANNH